MRHNLRVAKGSNSFPPYLYRAHAAIRGWVTRAAAPSLPRAMRGQLTAPDEAVNLQFKAEVERGNAQVRGIILMIKRQMSQALHARDVELVEAPPAWELRGVDGPHQGATGVLHLQGGASAGRRAPHARPPGRRLATASSTVTRQPTSRMNGVQLIFGASCPED